MWIGSKKLKPKMVKSLYVRDFKEGDTIVQGEYLYSKGYSSFIATSFHFFKTDAGYTVEVYGSLLLDHSMEFATPGEKYSIEMEKTLKVYILEDESDGYIVSTVKKVLSKAINFLPENIIKINSW